MTPALPSPPAGSEHYREGWTNGYEQARIDRERTAETPKAAAGLNLIVTVTDPLTGHTETAEIPPHDYMVITTGECTYSVQAYATGTHQITIRGRHV